MRFTVVVCSVGAFLAIGLALTFFPYDLLRTPWLAFVISCLVVTLGAGVPLGHAWSALEGQASRKPIRNYLNALLLASFLGMMTSWCVIRGWIPAINAWFDDSPRVQHRTSVQSFGSGRMKRFIHVDSWHGNESEFLQVSKDVAGARPRSVVVTTRAGFLGFEWVVDVVVAP